MKYEIKLESGKEAKIEIGPSHYWAHTGDSPRKAVQNLMFFMENELQKLEMVDKEDLTEAALKRREILDKFVNGSPK